MKKLFFIIAVCTVYISNAQTLSYNDIGVLFTNEQINGTARYNALSGAFGSLGGDLSAISGNPAGAAVFLNSEMSFTVDFNTIKTDANYYGERTYSSYDDVEFSQMGGVFVFRTNYGNQPNSGWGKVAVAFDYSKSADFDNFWYAQGNSGYPTWVNDPNSPDPDSEDYPFSDGQYLENATSGRNNKYTFTIASEYNNKIYLGASFISNDVDFYQSVLMEEYNDDGNNNYLDASMFQQLSTYGYGYSFNLGIIAKATDNLRLGFAYQSPVWYDLGERFLDYDLELYVSNVDEYHYEYSDISSYYYNLRTPSRYTGSLSYIFGKSGLISVDYIYRNYSNITLTNGNWNQENQDFNTYLRGTSEVRVGTEWRVEKLSLRGGYHFKQNPYKNSYSSDDNQGFSFGLGYNFGPVKLDIAYQQDSRTGVYDFYPQYDEVNPVELDYKLSKFTASLIINI